MRLRCVFCMSCWQVSVQEAFGGAGGPSVVDSIWVCVVGAWGCRCGVAGASDDAVCTSGRVVFCAWFTALAWLAGYLRDYRAGLGVPLSTKVVTLVVMWAGMGISAWWVHRIWVAVVLVVIGVGVTIHLCRLRTRRVMDDARSLSVGGESVGEGEKPEV